MRQFLGCPRIDESVRQSAERQIGPLRQKQAAPVAHPDAPPPKRPKTGNGAQQGAFAEPGSTGDQQRLPRGRREGDARPQRPSVRQVEIECIDLDAGTVTYDFDRLRPLLLRRDLVDLLAESGEPLHHRLIFGDLRIGADDERQRLLHLPEGGGDLHEAAKLDHFVEIARGRHQKRKNDRDLIITVGEPSQLLAADYDPPPICHDTRKAGLECVQLARFASVEGDVLGVLAQSDHAEAEIRLVTLLVEAKLD